MRIPICLTTLAAAACSTTVQPRSNPSSGGKADHEGDVSDASAVAGSSVLRLITGDDTVIAADWTASEGGHTFSVVKDGTPLEPWISSAHEAGSKSLAFGVNTDTSGHKQRVEYKIAQAADVDGLHFDNARYAGFAMKLGDSPAPFTSSAIFWQAWQGYPYGPPVSLKFEASDAPPFRIRLAIRNATTGPASTVPDITLWEASMIGPTPGTPS